MKESHIEGLATHDDPKPSAGVRKDEGEASVGARSGTVLSREIRKSGAPTPLSEAEGNTSQVRQGDTIDHEWLVKFVEHRIQDGRVLRLIQKWLNAGVMEEGNWAASEMGTPQGATISPLLANIYLHYVVDLWAAQWRKTRATGEMIIVRYAADSSWAFSAVKTRCCSSPNCARPRFFPRAPNAPGPPLLAARSGAMSRARVAEEAHRRPRAILAGIELLQDSSLRSAVNVRRFGMALSERVGNDAPSSR